MKTLSRSLVGSIAAVAAFAQAAFAGVVGGYVVDPVIEDSNSDAGLFLLLAVATFLVIRAANTPNAAEPSAEAADPTDPTE